MSIRKTQIIQCMVLAIIIPLFSGACGNQTCDCDNELDGDDGESDQICFCEDESDETYYFNVDVINNTDAPITVRYDWSNWVIQEDTITINNKKTISWLSENWDYDYIEVDYRDKTIYYSVSTTDTVQVYTRDFQ